MSYIYKGLDGDKLKILDDSDLALECFDYSDILVFMLDGIKIEGLSLKRNKIYSDGICLEPKKAKNKNLTKAKKVKNDEFYTQLSDIEKELSHYPIETFKDKIIYCPMDVATNTGAILQSQFVKYFQMNAHRLQFKKLIATCLVEKATGDGVCLMKNDIGLVIFDKKHQLYFCGMKKWSNQLRLAQVFHSEKYLNDRIVDFQKEIERGTSRTLESIDDLGIRTIEISVTDEKKCMIS